MKKAHETACLSSSLILNYSLASGVVQRYDILMNHVCANSHACVALPSCLTQAMMLVTSKTKDGVGLEGLTIAENTLPKNLLDAVSAIPAPLRGARPLANP
jgi:hypothetical protein